MTTNGVSILIADHQRSRREHLLTYLSNEYTCATAKSGAQARKLLAASRFDLIAVDITMTDPSGIDLSRQVRNAYPDTAVIGLLGTNEVHRLIEAVRQGAFEYLSEPLNFREVTASVERTLRHQQFVGKAQLLHCPQTGCPETVDRHEGCREQSRSDLFRRVVAAQTGIASSVPQYG